MTTRLTGLVAAPHTPLHEDGSLNLATVEPQVALLLEAGVRGAFICGTTGEAHSLSVEERLRTAERWAAVAGKQMPLVVHVGHNCLSDARTLAAHAAKIGATAIAALAPSYFKPADVDDLVGFCAAVAAAAPGVPFYYYDIPSFTGVQLSSAEFLRRGAERIPTLAGIKFTNGDLMTLQECLGLSNGRFDVVFGYDEMLLAGLAFGARGAVGSTYNYAAPVYQRVLSAFERGDLETARREQRLSVELVRALLQFGVLRAGKAIMGLMGVDCGPVRPPLRRVSEAEKLQLYERTHRLDVFSRPLRRPEPAPA